MASTAHGTLTANTVTTVTITPGSEGLVVVNRSQTGAIWVRLDGIDPTVAGSNSYVVLGARDFPQEWRNRTPGQTTITVKLISAGALDYSVEAAG